MSESVHKYICNSATLVQLVSKVGVIGGIKASPEIKRELRSHEWEKDSGINSPHFICKHCAIAYNSYKQMVIVDSFSKITCLTDDEKKIKNVLV